MEAPFGRFHRKPLEGIDPGRDRDDIETIGVRGLNIRGCVAYHANRCPRARSAHGSTRHIIFLLDFAHEDCSSQRCYCGSSCFWVKRRLAG
jgi:hypothetical protein